MDPSGAGPLPPGDPSQPGYNNIPGGLTPEQFALLPHDSAAGRLVISIWVMNVVALLFLLARCYCKWLRHRGLWWDDGILIGAYVSPLTTRCGRISVTRATGCCRD